MIQNIIHKGRKTFLFVDIKTFQFNKIKYKNLINSYFYTNFLLLCINAWHYFFHLLNIYNMLSEVFIFC